MNARNTNTESNSTNAICCGIDELTARIGLGTTKADELAGKAGARFKYGRRTLYNLKKIEAYIDKLSESEAV